MEGLFTIQDETSQLISFILDPQPGEKILDACSAPGGKAGHIAELMADTGEVVELRYWMRQNLWPLKKGNLTGFSLMRRVRGQVS
ncbi:MAG: rsmB [Deltaproteobacteria bacterium]|nr:rsmB [Deltaproteobacteria bacterium]